jgi:DNA (cytosine-5)-methyltransferase 1
MRVLDLFCGAGGAAMGLHQAWPEAEITGVDIKYQPHYPFRLIVADALNARDFREYDFLWASPMCQGHTWAARRWKKKWPLQIPKVRSLFKASGKPFTIENVVGAPLENPVRLCGRMFGLKVIRHRLFESSFPMLVPPHPKCSGAIARGEAYTVAGHGAESKSYKYQDWADAMGIQWMTKTELTQAIPPAYSRFIAEQFTQSRLATEGGRLLADSGGANPDVSTPVGEQSKEKT